MPVRRFEPAKKVPVSPDVSGAPGDVPLLPHQRAILGLMKNGADATEEDWSEAATAPPTKDVAEDKQITPGPNVNENEDAQVTDILDARVEDTDHLLTPHAAEKPYSLIDSSQNALIDFDDATNIIPEKNGSNAYLDDLMELDQMMSVPVQPSTEAKPSTTAKKPISEQFSQPLLELVHDFSQEKYTNINLVAPEVAKFLETINYSPPRGMKLIRYATYLLVQWHLGPLEEFKALKPEEQKEATDMVFATFVGEGCRITRTAQGMLALRDSTFPCPTEVEEFNKMVRTGNYEKKPQKTSRTVSTVSKSEVTTTATRSDIFSRVDLDVENKPVIETATRGPLGNITNAATTTAAPTIPPPTAEAEKKKLIPELTLAADTTRPLCGWDLL